MKHLILLYRGQTRTEVRKKALDVLSLVLSINTHVYEVSLLLLDWVDSFDNGEYCFINSCRGIDIDELG